MKQLSLSGTAVEISGSGPPVVLLHGVGLNQSIWAGQVKALESDFQLITYDLLGMDETPQRGNRPACGLGRASLIMSFAIWRWKSLLWWGFPLAG